MASQTPSHHIQIVGGDQNRVFYIDELECLIRRYCNRCKEHYTVISIIGVQSSGKSTLLNALFNTRFQTLNQETGRKATTKGICAAICSDRRVLLLDIEGTDGDEKQDDARFANQSALFGLEVSDVIIFNINLQNIGLTEGASIPLLHTVLQERLLSENKHKSKLVFAVRDYNKKTPEPMLHDQLILTLNKIWDKLSKDKSSNNKMPSISQYFELSVEFFPNLDYKPEAFQNKCKDIVNGRHSSLLDKGEQNWPVDEFPLFAKELWEKIRKNKRLDVPSYWKRISQERCETMMSAKVSSLQCNEEYKSLESVDKPSTFEKRFKEFMKNILSEYEGETQYYVREVANECKRTLVTKITKDAESKFRTVMNKFIIALCEQAAEEIKSKSGSPFQANGHIKSVFSYYNEIFIQETKDLKIFNDIKKEDQEKFVSNLKRFGDLVANEAKIKSMKDIALYVFFGIGAATVIAASTVDVIFTGGTISTSILISSLGSTYSNFAGRAMVEKFKSDDTFQRSVDQIMAKLPEEFECNDSSSSSSATVHPFLFK